MPREPLSALSSSSMTAMARLTRNVLMVAALTLIPIDSPAFGQGETIHMGSYPSLSNDGSFFVFSWRDDLWRCDVDGRVVTRLTTHPAQDNRPFLSPDNKTIAFISNREGNEQIWLMPLEGGTPKRLSIHTERTAIYGWLPDGSALLARSRRDEDWRRSSRLFRVPIDGELGQESVLFDATGSIAAISPDGEHIAFGREGIGWMRKGYRGPQVARIWRYHVKDKTFHQLSQGDHNEMWTCFSPDSKTIYFCSDEDGTYNIWQSNIDGKERKQLTRFEDDGALFPTISGDGNTLVFRRLFDFYRLDLTKEGAKPEQLTLHASGDPTIEPTERRTLTRATDVAFTQDGLETAFVSGGDLYVMDMELREPVQVTKTPAEEADPVFSKDLKFLYFTTDASGQPDIWRAERADPKKFWWQNQTFTVKQMTNDTSPEWDLRITPDGKNLAYLKDRGDIYLHDIKENTHKRIVQTWNDPYYDFSPDGHWITYAIDDNNFNSDVWIARVDGSVPPVNVSMHPDNDSWPSWSPDGKILAWVGRRWSEESDICYVYLTQEDGEKVARDRTLEKALKAMKSRTDKAKKKKTAKKAASKKATSKDVSAKAKPKAPDKVDSIAGTWSGMAKGPDPMPKDGSVLRVTLVRGEDDSLSGSFEVVDQLKGALDSCTFDADKNVLTAKATTELGPLALEATLEGEILKGSWVIENVLEGTFELSREGESNPKGDPKAKPSKGDPSPADKKKGEATSKDAKKKDAKKKAKKPMELDLEGIQDRIRRIAIPNARESFLTWSPSGKTLAFRTAVNGSRGTYKVTFPDKLKPSKLSSLTGTHAQWIKTGDKICWLQGGLPATLSGKGSAKSYAFQIQAETHWPSVYASLFHRCWQIMRDAFYDSEMSNTDWEAIRAKFSPALKTVATVDDVDTLINMMLGELNASHMGFRPMTGPRFRPKGWRPLTGHLGMFFDSSYKGEGVRVERVIAGTPPDLARSRIAPGEIVLSIDDLPLSESTNWTKVLTGDLRKERTLRVKNDEGKIRKVQMRPISYGTLRAGLYTQWIEDIRAQVDKVSEGRMGYIHIRSMNWSSFESFEADLYKAAHGREGLIIDVRDNGGGFTADHLLTCLTQPRHAITVPRGGGKGYPQDRMVYARWDQPIVVLCNQNSFSNAEIFAHAIKTLKRGKVVGVQTAGGVISTGGMMVMGLGTLRLPFRGWFLADTGEDMELNGCQPDHEVWITPEDQVNGRDPQLEKAIEALEEEIKVYKARPKPKLRTKATRLRKAK